MSGTPKGRIDCKVDVGVGTKDISSSAFVSLYQAFKELEAAGYVEEVANNWGNGSGFNYYNEASPIGTSGHFVFRLPPYGARTVSLYVLVLYAQSAALAGTARINGSNFSSDGGVAISFACAVDDEGNDASPLAAGVGTAKAGADARTSPFWAKPSGGKLWVGNRSGNAGGSFAASGPDLHSLINFASSVTVTTRWGLIADRDSVIFYADQGDAGSPNVVAAVQMQLDAEMAAVCDCPYVGFRYALSANSLFNGAQGATNGTGLREVCVPFASDWAGKIGGLWCGAALTAVLQPNSLTSKYVEQGLEVAAYETPHFGLVGRLDAFVGMTSNLDRYDTLNLGSARQRFLLGHTKTEGKLVVPWDGATTPQSAGSTRVGVSF